MSCKDRLYALSRDAPSHKREYLVVILLLCMSIHYSTFGAWQHFGQRILLRLAPICDRAVGIPTPSAHLSVNQFVPRFTPVLRSSQPTTVPTQLECILPVDDTTCAKLTLCRAFVEAGRNRTQPQGLWGRGRWQAATANHQYKA